MEGSRCSIWAAGCVHSLDHEDHTRGPCINFSLSYHDLSFLLQSELTPTLHLMPSFFLLLFTTQPAMKSKLPDRFQPFLVKGNTSFMPFPLVWGQLQFAPKAVRASDQKAWRAWSLQVFSWQQRVLGDQPISWHWGVKLKLLEHGPSSVKHGLPTSLQACGAMKDFKRSLTLVPHSVEYGNWALQKRTGCSFITVEAKDCQPASRSHLALAGWRDRGPVLTEVLN